MTDRQARTRATSTKLVRFALVGVANTAIDLAVFAVLLPHVEWPLLANGLAWLTAATFSFAANSLWSFERNRDIGAVASFLRFTSLGALISLGVSSAALAVLAGPFGVWPAKAVGVVTAAALNFLAARWSIEGSRSPR